jgi:hypothetical protein
MKAKPIQILLSFLFLILLSLNSMAAAIQNTIVALGDIEGQGHRFYDFITESGAFEQSSQGITLRPGYKFIFTGDSIDRGAQSMTILSELIRLKEKYPDEVVLLMGNRDINKLNLLKRFSAEISAGLDPKNDFTSQIQSLKQYFDIIGADEAFQFHKQEMELLTGRQLSDSEVFVSYLNEILPGGRLLKFLSLAQVAYYDEETRGIFIHGALSEKSIGRVPNVTNRIDNLKSWVDSLNTWARQAPTSELLDYQRPLKETPGRNDGSVITGRFSDTVGNPLFPNQNVQAYLMKNDIRYVAVGHTPYTDVPAIISDKNLKLVLLDNSYSNHRNKSVVRITRNEISATSLTDKNEVFILKASLMKDTKIEGHLANSGWLTLGKLSSGNYLQWRPGPHYTSLYQSLPPSQIKLDSRSVILCSQVLE